jgi:hypothetical protein
MNRVKIGQLKDASEAAEAKIKSIEYFSGD